ncbi:unannotated protein [freshwater metagenome]|uniref:Unannotated protein n=1 Tax=freshwater metagenome TaxID=449393 RepID=A0A6J7HXM3_9ZZZZ
MEWLYDHPAQGRNSAVNISEFDPAYPDRPALHRAGRWLMDAGMLEETPQRLGGGLMLRLAPAGADQVRWYRDQRDDHAAKERNCERALLAWLYEQRGEGIDSPVAHTFLEDWRATFWGEPFTTRDVDRATKYLRDLGFLQGEASWGGGVMRPTITSAGVSYVRGGMKDQELSSGAIYNIHVGSNSGQLQAGDGQFTQTQAQGLHAQELREMFQAMREAVFQVSEDDDRDALELQVRDLEEEVTKPTPDPALIEQRISRLRRLAEKIGSPALTAAISEATKAVLRAQGLN